MFSFASWIDENLPFASNLSIRIICESSTWTSSALRSESVIYYPTFASTWDGISSPFHSDYLYGLSANLAHEPPLRFAPSRSSARFLWICRHEKRVLQVNLRTLFHTCNSQIILSLWKLRCTTSCFQAVLREFLSCFPLILRAFPAFCFSVIRCADHKKRPFFIQR